MRSAAASLGALTLVALCVQSTLHTDEPKAPNASVALASLATDIAQSRSSESLAADVVVVLSAKDYPKVRTDGDLGPFVDLALKSGDDAVVVLMPPNVKDRSTRAVFFGGVQPRAWSDVGPSVSPEARYSAVVANRQTLTPPFPKGREQLHFEKGEVRADDGTPLEAFRVLSGGAR